MLNIGSICILGGFHIRHVGLYWFGSCLRRSTLPPSIQLLDPPMAPAGQGVRSNPPWS